MEKVKMEKLSICRICLDDNVCVNLVNNAQLHDIFERLTSTPFQTIDMRPVTLCYICHAQLNTIYRFTVKCLKAEEILTDMLSQIHTVIQGNRVVPKLTVVRRAVLNQLVYTETQLIDIDSSVPNVETVDVKEEIQINLEGAMKWEDQSLQGPSKMTDSEQEDEEVPPDPMEGMPLMNMKSERDEEVEGTGKSLIKAARKATKPKRALKATTTGVKLVNADTENGQAESSNPKDDIHDLVLNGNYQIDGRKKSKSSFICHVCGKILMSEQSFQNHLLLHSNERPYVCEICNKRYPVKSHLRLHLDRIHTGTGAIRYSCDICEKSYRTKGSLKCHMLVHSDTKRFVCNFCPKSFHRKEHLKFHNQTHTKERPFVCDVCPKSFQRKDHLKFHKQTHTQEVQFGCDICNKNVRDPTCLCNHKQKPAVKRPSNKIYLCNVCGKEFKTRSGFYVHSFKHTGEKGCFPCNVCKKSFIKKGALKLHSRIHTGERPYVCDICGKSFIYKYGLQIHAHIHTDEKPYGCDVCNTRYTTRASLKVHSLRHTGHKSFVCNICDKRFYRKGHLVIHTRMHTGERPYVCNYCDRAYTRKAYLISHIKLHTGHG